MSITTFVLGQSGTGKSTSMRNLNPADTLLIRVLPKPLPFRANGWGKLSKENMDGNIFDTDKADELCKIIQKSKKPIVIIDDFQYVMANEFMRRSSERGFDKFTEIGHNAWRIIDECARKESDQRFYLLSHTEQNDQGLTKMKTIGKMLDEKVTLEGMVTICLQTAIMNNEYLFMTQNNGANTVKSPMGMFNTECIPNDLAEVDKTICDFYSLPSF